MTTNEVIERVRNAKDARDERGKRSIERTLEELEKLHILISPGTIRPDGRGAPSKLWSIPEDCLGMFQNSW